MCIRDRFFKNFGITVVVSVLMSLAVARMITPMIAAYFLKAKGHAEHGEGVWMDRYMRLLNWVLDRSESDRIRQTLVPAKAAWWQYLIGFILFALIFAVFVGVAQMVGFMINDLIAVVIPSDFLRALLSLVFAIAAGLAAATLVAMVIRRVASALSSGFADWYAYRAGRFRARAHDHRIWMMGVGVVAFGITVILLSLIHI